MGSVCGGCGCCGDTTHTTFDCGISQHVRCRHGYRVHTRLVAIHYEIEKKSRVVRIPFIDHQHSVMTMDDRSYEASRLPHRTQTWTQPSDEDLEFVKFQSLVCHKLKYSACYLSLANCRPIDSSSELSFVLRHPHLILYATECPGMDDSTSK